MARGIRRLLILFAVLAAVSPTSALAAERPCAEAVLDDWSDGRIDGVYDRDCYLGAIEILPEDVRAYTTAADDIARALQARSSEPGGAAPAQERSLAGVDPAGAASVSSRGVPAALLLLGAIAVSVLAAGSAGVIARRVRVRRRS
jgi:hypothetical protein